MKIKILGFGEIGKSWMEVYKAAGYQESEIAYKEVDHQKGDIDCDLLHVCMPFKDLDSFIKIIGRAIQESACRFVVIHSTIGPGTTKYIQDAYQDIVIVHSPVTGVHPNLADGIRTFPRWIGYDCSYNSMKPIIDHFKSLGITDFHIASSIGTELLKLMCTTYYGVCIAFHAEMKEILNINGVPWEWFILWNEQYNEGYSSLGKANVVRPVLENLKLPIGGHCVVPNAKILSNHFHSEFFELIKKYGGAE